MGTSYKYTPETYMLKGCNEITCNQISCTLKWCGKSIYFWTLTLCMDRLEKQSRLMRAAMHTKYQ